MTAKYIVKSSVGVFGRTGPGKNYPKGKYKSGKLKGRAVVRPLGWDFKPTATKRVDGELWLKGETLWYWGGAFRKATSVSSSSTVIPRSPVPGYGCNYQFGTRNSRYAAGYHTGDDFAAPIGAKIVSMYNGTVVRADWGGAYGNWTIIDCEYNGKKFQMMYAHQSRRAVRVGQKVRAGQVIGYVGISGNVTGPHLHIERSKGRYWRYGSVVNPVK